MGTEKDTELKDEKVIDTAITDAEKAEKEFDKDRQRADQAEANFRKAKAEKERLDTELESQRQKAAELQAQIDELKAGKNAEKDVVDQIPDIDPEKATVEDYGKAMKQMRTVIAGLTKKLAQVETKGQQSESERQREKLAAREKADRDKTFEDLCRELDEEFGPGLRNDAIKKMEERVAAEGEPSNAVKATLIFRKCYAAAKAEAEQGKAKDKSKRIIPTDTGGGGRTRFGSVQIKKGSLDDVVAQFERASPG